MGQDGQRRALAMFVLHTGEILLGRRVGADKADGRCRARPLELGVANVRA
jgi:hypothetical protein